MRCALEQVIEIVTESRSCGENKILPASIHDGIKDFKVGVEAWRGRWGTRGSGEVEEGAEKQLRR